MLEIICKRPKQFDLARLGIESRPYTTHFVILVAEGGKRKTIRDEPSATAECCLSDCRNPGLANHVRGPKEPFNYLDLSIGNCIFVFIRPRLCGTIDSRRSRLDAAS